MISNEIQIQLSLCIQTCHLIKSRISNEIQVLPLSFRSSYPKVYWLTQQLEIPWLGIIPHMLNAHRTLLFLKNLKQQSFMFANESLILMLSSIYLAEML